MPSLKNISPIYPLLASYLLAAFGVMWYFDGTGDTGDSINHFLHSQYAFQHPELFFNHWGKPVFILLSSSFTQFGFVGMKLFNVLVVTLTLYLLFRIAESIYSDTSRVWVVVLLAWFMPLYFILTFSGLTEPLFALVLIAGIYLIANKQQLTWALVLVSFLPFVRSEGLVMVGVFGLYALLDKKWRLLPLLGLGHLVYGIAGMSVYGTPLWVFQKIPYAHKVSKYGSGDWFHFADKLTYVIGIPIYVLLGIGSIAIAVQALRYYKEQPKHHFLPAIAHKQEQLLFVLILGGFFVFFMAHTAFWALGLFHSMGLKRVFVGVVPLMAIIAFHGWQTLGKIIASQSYRTAKVIRTLLLFYVLVFPFTGNPAAIKWDKAMRLTPEQHLVEEVAHYLKENDLLDGNVIIHAHPYLNHLLALDPFDPKRRQYLTSGTLKRLPQNSVVVWDSWFAVEDNGVGLELIEAQGKLVKRKIFENKAGNPPSKLVIFDKSEQKIKAKE
ncbi:MAG: hypothetical protein ACPGXL_07490 [Chitinophagales bacterium]